MINLKARKTSTVADNDNQNLSTKCIKLEATLL